LERKTAARHFGFRPCPLSFQHLGQSLAENDKEFYKVFLMVILMSFGFFSFWFKSKNDLFQSVLSGRTLP
jgi:hypothetical protein